MEVFEFLIIFINLIVPEKDVNSSVQKYFLVDVNRHFLIVSLDECDYFVQGLLVFDVFEHFRDEEIENLV